MQRRIYPKEMQENASTILSILGSTNLSRGLFERGGLIGYALFQRTRRARTIYLYDIAILPRLQHMGLGTKLVQEVLTATWERRLRVKMHVRATSYPLFVNRNKLRAAGYRLVSNKFVHDFYFKEFGIHEDAHELIMEPLANGPGAGARTG
jgi:GNAT superfamily N-acetyltransferase